MENNLTAYEVKIKNSPKARKVRTYIRFYANDEAARENCARVLEGEEGLTVVSINVAEVDPRFIQ